MTAALTTTLARLLEEVTEKPQTAFEIASARRDRLPRVVQQLRVLEAAQQVRSFVTCTTEDLGDPVAWWVLA